MIYYRMFCAVVYWVLLFQCIDADNRTAPAVRHFGLAIAVVALTRIHFPKRFEP